MAKTISLQRKLLQTSMLGSVVAGVIALILLVGISIYQTMSVQDEIMDEISDMLLISDLTANSGQQVDELSSEFDIEYQLRMNQHVLTQSTQYSFPQDQFITQKDEYSYIWYKKKSGVVIMPRMKITICRCRFYSHCMFALRKCYKVF